MKKLYHNHFWKISWVVILCGMFLGCFHRSKKVESKSTETIEKKEEVSDEPMTLSETRKQVLKFQKEVDLIKHQLKFLRSPVDQMSEKDFYLSELLETKRLLEITERDLIKAEADSKEYRLKYEGLLSQIRKNAPPWPTEREVENSRRDLDDSQRNLRFVEDILTRYQDGIKRLEKLQSALEKKEEITEKNLEKKRKLQVDLDAAYESLREATAQRDRMIRERRRPVLK